MFMTDPQWDITRTNAAFGRAPIGGKSVFPVGWSIGRVSDAIVSALHKSTV